MNRHHRFQHSPRALWDEVDWSLSIREISKSTGWNEDIVRGQRNKRFHVTRIDMLTCKRDPNLPPIYVPTKKPTP